MSMSPPIRALVIDDSVFMRAMLKDALAATDGVEVVGTAQNGSEGLQKLLSLKPDVATLDIEMPGMTGLEVLEQVMKKQPTPIIVVSTKTQTGAATTIEALRLGAVECVAKPLADKNATLEAFRDKVVRAVKAAAAVNRRNLTHKPVVVAAPPTGGIPLDCVVAIGISAGGPATLHQMLPAIPAVFPPIVITQHMPAGFTAAFAERLDQICKISVKEAAAQDELTPGTAYIAPGDLHLKVASRGGRLVVTLSDGPKVSGFRPSVDVMFDSLASCCGPRTVAIVMTGMGNDGSAGIRLLKKAGAATLAQDAESSVVYGMPKAAAETGCVDRVVGLDAIPSALVEALQAKGGAAVRGRA